jgi:hypothetical protein
VSRARAILVSASVLWAGSVFANTVAERMGEGRGPAVIRPAKKAKKKKAALRGPASLPAPASVIETLVFSEFTSFEDMLAAREKLERKPSSFQLKARVIGVRRDIGLSDKEDNKSQRDIILNAGSNSGMSKGMTLTVKRHIPILDPYRENKQRELEIDFAKLEVVHVQDDISVARVSKLYPIDEALSVGLRSVLIGDYVGTGQ